MIVDIESDPRHAGGIRRYHTWPVIRQQTVAEHTWQVMRIMMTVDVGMCTTRLMHYAVLHDVGEMAGDIPWPGKRNSRRLKEAMDEAEKRVRGDMVRKWNLPSLPVLTDAERAFFKCCECLEMWEFGMQERSMGNRYGTVIEARMIADAMGYLHELPTDTIERVQQYVERRTAQESEVELVKSNDPDDAAQFVERREA